MYQVDSFRAERQPDGTYRLRWLGMTYQDYIPVGPAPTEGTLASWWEGYTLFVATVAVPEPEPEPAHGRVWGGAR